MGYFKAGPTEHVIQYRRGDVKREGRGLSFFYTRWASNLVLVPLSTQDRPFVFNEVSGNFQEVTIQGLLTYRVVDPQRLAEVLDYSIRPGDRTYRSEDPEKLADRLLNIVQLATRGQIAHEDLEKVLQSARAIAGAVLETSRTHDMLETLGVELVSLHISSIRPTPEMSNALEAEYREGVQKKADEAIYARRAAAVEQERKIEENQLTNRIALEEQRSSLVELEGQNERARAIFEAEAIEMRLKPYQQMGAQAIMALAMKDLGENAGRISNLSITPELLAAIAGAKA